MSSDLVAIEVRLWAGQTNMFQRFLRRYQSRDLALGKRRVLELRAADAAIYGPTT